MSRYLQVPNDLSPNKCKEMKRQIEYYFDDANWAKDDFLKSMANEEVCNMCNIVYCWIRIILYYVM